MVSVASLKKVSAASGLFFGAFLVLHLISHYTLLFGIDAANDTLRLFRKVYQNPVFEVALLVALLAHMASNTLIYLKRRNADAAAFSSKKDGNPPAPVSLELRGHRLAGYFLAASIFGHVAVTRLAPLWLLEDPSQYDYGFIAHASNLFGAFFAAYVALLGMAGGWHLIYGTRSALATLKGTSVTGTPFPFALKPVAAISHVLVVNAVLALAGFYSAIDTETKADLHAKVYFLFHK
jgi:succinate dehydrogenase/fumarate reductase cytochrome b subunit